MLVDQRFTTATFHEPFENPVDVGAGNPAGQLAVAEASGSAFAEQVVVLLLELTTAIECSDCRNALLHWLSAFDDDRSKASRGQVVAGQQSGRAGTDDDRACGHRWTGRRWIVERFGGECVGVGIRQHCGLHRAFRDVDDD